MPEIRTVLFSPDVEEKLFNGHRLTQWDVEHVIFDPANEPRWDVDPNHGGRLVIRGYTPEAEPRLIFVSLRPVDMDEGVWACITAFPPSRENYGSGGD